MTFLTRAFVSEVLRPLTLLLRPSCCAWSKQSGAAVTTGASLLFPSLLALICSLALLSPCLYPPTAEAQTRDWLLTDPPTQPHCPTFPDPNCIWYGQGPFSAPTVQVEPNALINRLYTRYDASSKRWNFEITMVDNPALAGQSIPNSFWMVINHGPMPYYVGVASILYFDATSPGTPILTVYGYNAAHELFDRSWADGNGEVAGDQAPDQICSSLAPGSCGNWVKSLTSSVDAVTGARTFSFEVDATPILSHAPLYHSAGTWHSPGPGAEPLIFGAQLGIWLHMGASRTYNYLNGFISEVAEGATPSFDPVAIYYDREFIATNQPPMCVSNLAASTLRPGQTVTWNVIASDPDGAIASVTGDSTPAGAITCTNENLPNGTARRACSYTAPSAPHSGGTSVHNRSVFVDNRGTSVNCSDDLTVVNIPPTCTLSVAPGQVSPSQGSSIACEGASTTVDLISTVSDSDPDVIQRNYNITCDNGTVSLSSNEPPVASVTGPALGVATACTVTLQVSDGFDTASCNAAFSVAPCALDCARTPLGTRVIDRCGVCGGTNACLDCRGAAFGTTSVDRCGVCGGDGQSCLGCTTISIFKQLAAVDSRALQAKSYILNALNSLRRIEQHSRASAKFARSVKRQAEAIYTVGWTQTWSISANILTCTNSLFCSNLSTDTRIADLRQSFAALENLYGLVVKRISTLDRAAAVKLTGGFNKLRKNFEVDLSKLPPAQSICR